MRYFYAAPAPILPVTAHTAYRDKFFPTHWQSFLFFICPFVATFAGTTAHRMDNKTFYDKGELDFLGTTYFFVPVSGSHNAP
jgi:hypothetical protein